MKQQFRAGSESLGKAAKRLRDKDARDAVADEKLYAELRRAAEAMAAGYAAASHPKKRRRRLGRAVLAVGLVGAGTYAGYRAVCEMQKNGVSPVARTTTDDRDETVAASFPASDPPPGP